LDLLDGIEHELHEPRERVVDVFVVHHHDPLGTGPFPEMVLKAAYVSKLAIYRSAGRVPRRCEK
jgi:hypothetical protein